MARYPQAGHVKSRLAASVGAETAARIYRAFLSDLGARLGADARWVLHWAYDPPSSRFVDDVAGAAEAFPQVSGDLGERMADAIRRLLGEGYRRVVLIGSDVPHLSPAAVARAFHHLAEGAELVLGPVEDGGYCLIGAVSVPPVFEDVSWGRSDVLAETLLRAARFGIVPRTIESTYDVDDFEGLARLSEDIRSGRVEGLTATRKALEELPAVRYG